LEVEKELCGSKKSIVFPLKSKDENKVANALCRNTRVNCRKTVKSVTYKKYINRNYILIGRGG
jgi:hypothetical protein